MAFDDKRWGWQNSSFLLDDKHSERTANKYLICMYPWYDLWWVIPEITYITYIKSTLWEKKVEVELPGGYFGPM